MKRSCVLLAIVCASVLASSAVAQVTVTLTQPLNGATVTSPVTVKASASSTRTITGWRIYVDGTSIYHSGAARSISTSVTMTSGTHKMTVRAWASNGAYSSAVASVTVEQSSGSVSVGISPTSAVVQCTKTQQFSASVGGTTNTAVTWLVNGVQGGNSTIGTVSPAGLYTAPAAVPSGSSVTVTARSAADATKSASAAVTVAASPSPITVAVSPTSATVKSGSSQQFTATVTGTTNASVNWYVNGTQGGNATVGTVSSSGLYTAPAVVPAGGTITLTARSAYDSTQAANATITVQASTTAVAVSVTPATATVRVSQSQQFTATVTGTTDTSVRWLVNGVQGGSSTTGTISTAGMYSAPSTVPAGGTVSITAQSAFDSTKSANASVTVQSNATNYYISTTGSDSNNCTASAPCRTINSVNSRLGGSLPLGSSGTVIHVAAGTYTSEPIINKNGTATARIRYISDTQWGAKIVTSGTGESFKNYGDYVDIVGFDVSGDGVIGIDNQGSYNRILGNRVHDIGLTKGCTAGAGIYTDDTNYSNGSTPTQNDIIGNWVYNVGNVSAPCSLIHGIYVAGPYANVMNNVAYRNAGWGVHLWHGATNVVIANNTIFYNGRGGILVGCGDSYCTVNDYTTVVNNIVMDSVQGYGISENGTTGAHNVYSNNLAFNNPSGSFYLKNGLACSGCMTTSPQFVNYQASGGGDYQLTATSPAVDAGTSSKAPTSDMAGGPRPVNSRVDIGAYEYGAAAAPWVWY